MHTVSFLQEKDIAHNFMAVPSPGGRPGLASVYLFPRRNTLQSDETELNIAVLELTGQFIVKSRRQLDMITEEYLCERIAEAQVPDAVWESILAHAKTWIADG